MSTVMDPSAESLARALDRAGAGQPDVALVLGSGLGSFADALTDVTSVLFADLEDMPRSTVPGHAGRFVFGSCGGVRVVVQQGRVHLYEGWSPRTITRSVRAFAHLGCRALVLTNAAGGLVADWPVPCLMRIRDHLNMQGQPPLLRDEASFGCPYDSRLADALHGAAHETGLTLQSGVYAGLPGPSYETPAEVRFLGQLGAHAVGMSTVAEAVVGAAAGLAVAGLSCISNAGAGLSDGPLNHEEVVEAGATIAEDFCQLLTAAVPRIVAELG